MKKREKFLLFTVAAVIFLTAFEVRKPVFFLGSLGFTNAELSAIVFLITFAVVAWKSDLQIFTFRAMDAAVIVFLSSNFLSTVVSADMLGSLKFSTRMALAALVYFGISRLPSRKPAHLVVAGSIAAALLAVSLLAMLENFVRFIDWEFWLSPWQESRVTFGIFSQRISATLPFPTVFSMYLEMATPVALAFGLWWRSHVQGLRARRWLSALLLIGITAAVVAQLLTFTRSALVAFPLALLLAAAAAKVWGVGRRTHLYFASCALLLILLAAGGLFISNRLASRVGIAEEKNPHSAEYAILQIPSGIKTGQLTQVRIRVKNTSGVSWLSTGDDQMILAYRWFKDRQQERVKLYRTPLPRDVGPGESVDVEAQLFSPETPGRYILSFELLDKKDWFSANWHVRPATLLMDIDEQGSRILPLPEEETRFIWFNEVVETPSRPALWQAAVSMWKDHPVLGVGPDQFRLRYGEYMTGVPTDERVRANNIFLEALANTGVVGLLSLLYMLATAVRFQLKLIKDRSLDYGRRVLSLGLFVALFGYTTHGLLDNFLWLTGIAFLFFAQLGLISWIEHGSDNRSRNNP